MFAYIIYVNFNNDNNYVKQRKFWQYWP